MTETSSLPDILKVPTTFGLEGSTTTDIPENRVSVLPNSDPLRDKKDALLPRSGYKRAVIDQARYLTEKNGLTFPDEKFPNHYYAVEYGELLISKHDSILTRLGRSTDQHSLSTFAIEEAHDFASRIMQERVTGETDPLTGLLNRRGYERQLLYVLEDAIANNEPLCIVVGDVNGLKLVNDTEGHAAGDKLITGAAGALDGRHRSTDILTILEARYGGDEFRLVMPMTPIEGAQAWAAENTYTFRDAGISIGLGAIEINPEELRGKSKEELLKYIEECSEIADAASYAAKDLVKKEGKHGSLLLPSDHPLVERQLLQMRESRANSINTNNPLASSV